MDLFEVIKYEDDINKISELSISFTPGEKFNAFKNACKQGNIKLANILIDLNYVQELDSFCATFSDCCSKGQLIVAKWLLELYPKINISRLDDYPFVTACANGHLEVAQWLLQMKPSIDITNKNNYAFSNACTNGHIHVVKWLLIINPDIELSSMALLPIVNSISYKGHFEILKLIYEYFHLNFTTKIFENVFRFSCSNGHLETAQWILGKNPNINIYSNAYYAFKYASLNGHIHVVSWLLLLNNNVLNNTFGLTNDILELSFEYACNNGHIDICKLLLEYNPNIVITASMFRGSCQNGHLTLSKWLYALTPQLDHLNDSNNFNINNFNNFNHFDYQELIDQNVFKLTCKFGHLNVAKWLYEIQPNIRDQTFNISFLLACENNHLETAKWLIQLKPNLDITIENNKLFNMKCFINNYKMVKWLMKIRPYYYNVTYSDIYENYIVSWSVNSLNERKWLERKYALLGFHKDSNSSLQILGPDMIRYICEFV
jgi:ankyrin repeat protein